MGPNGNDRLDRIEGSLERLAETGALLYQYQVETSANLDKLIGIVDTLAENVKDQGERGTGVERALENFITVTGARMKSIEEAQEQTQRNLNGLIRIVDEIIRNRPAN